MRRATVLFSRTAFGPNLLIVVLLGFGLGAAALLHAALDRLLLHPLRVPDEARLVRAAERHPPVTTWSWFPFTTFERMRSMRSLDALAVEGNVETTVTENSRVEPAFGSMVSGSYFSMLGGKADLGRTLIPTDDSVATAVPVVLSHRFWMNEFDGSKSVLGRTLHLQGRPFTIVGVMPQRFFGTKLDASPDFWIPLCAQALFSSKTLTAADPDQRFSIVGHLRSGATPAEAQAEFSGIYRGDKQTFGGPESQGLIVPIAEGSFALREQFSRALNLLRWGLGAMLAMVCASIAGMLVARAARNERATAVRMALGASHLRLAIGALLESLTLGSIGAACGLGFAYLLAPFLARQLPEGRTPLPVSLQPDAGTAWLVVALAIGVSVIFGTIPAWITTRVKPQQALRGGTATRQSSLLSRGLMVFETGATLVLLLGTGLLIHTLYALRHADLGFDAEHLATFTLNLSLPGSDGEALATLPQQLTERIKALPGVSGVGFSGMALMQRIGMKTSVALPGQKIMPQAFLNTSLNTVSDGFLDALGIPLVAGRRLEPVDAIRSSPTPAIINEAFARTFFAGTNPLGRTFGTGARGEVAKAQNIVVGVVGDSKYRSLRESLLPIFYQPLKPSQIAGSQLYLYVRTTGHPDGIVRAVREKLIELEPQLPITKVETMQQQVDESLWQERLLVALAAIFSTVSVLLAGLGMYGLLAYDATRREREFGIRAALGARRTDMGRLMLKELAWIILPGLALGGVGCMLVGRSIASMLYGVGPYDFWSWSGALLAVAAIAALAAFKPVVRAMRADASVVLRAE
jgi:predicted permease